MGVLDHHLDCKSLPVVINYLRDKEEHKSMEIIRQEEPQPLALASGQAEGDVPASQTLIPLNVSTLAPWLDWINKFDFDQLNEDSAN
jgi:hypothetical protein